MIRSGAPSVLTLIDRVADGFVAIDTIAWPPPLPESTFAPPVLAMNTGPPSVVISGDPVMSVADGRDRRRARRAEQGADDHQGPALNTATVHAMAGTAHTGVPASFTQVFGPLRLALLALAALVIAVAGALLPATWAARARPAIALRAPHAAPTIRIHPGRAARAACTTRIYPGRAARAAPHPRPHPGCVAHSAAYNRICGPHIRRDPIAEGAVAWDP